MKQEKIQKQKFPACTFYGTRNEELREYLGREYKLSKEESRICARIKRLMTHALPRKKKKEKEDDDWCGISVKRKRH